MRDNFALMDGYITGRSPFRSSQRFSDDLPPMKSGTLRYFIEGAHPAIISMETFQAAQQEFDEALWGSLVEYVTVSKDKTMVFTMIGGTEITAQM